MQLHLTRLRLPTPLLFYGLLMVSTLIVAGEVEVAESWIREAPPRVPMAGYMKITNHSAENRVLVDAEGEDFSQVELHRTLIDNGMMRMVTQPQIELPPGSSILFEPSGYHLMLIQPLKRLMAGESTVLTLQFANGERMPVTFPVIKGRFEAGGSVNR